jgi:hypothetical protein
VFLCASLLVFLEIYDETATLVSAFSVLLFGGEIRPYAEQVDWIGMGGRIVCCRDCICSQTWKTQGGDPGHLQVLPQRWRWVTG